MRPRSLFPAIALAMATIVACGPRRFDNSRCPVLQRLATPSDPLALVPGPRCVSSDPHCGPEPFVSTCLENTGYDALATRVVLEKLRPPPAPECSYDGECRNSGCGYACVSTRYPAPMFTCEGRPNEEKRLADAYCGCIAGRCTWFEQ